MPALALDHITSSAAELVIDRFPHWSNPEDSGLQLGGTICYCRMDLPAEPVVRPRQGFAPYVMA